MDLAFVADSQRQTKGHLAVAQQNQLQTVELDVALDTKASMDLIVLDRKALASMDLIGMDRRDKAMSSRLEVAACPSPTTEKTSILFQTHFTINIGQTQTQAQAQAQARAQAQAQTN